jgi:hypothetical protein
VWSRRAHAGRGDLRTRRRFEPGARLHGTNAFSKKVENHAHAVSLHFMHYNFCRTHKTLTNRHGKPTTPAMAAGVARAPWSLTQLAELLH